MYEELIERLREAPSDWYDASLHYKAADAIEDLIAALAASNEVIAKGKPRWIPATERLPEENQLVIGFTPVDGYMFVGYYFSYMWGGKTETQWRIITSMRSTKDVTKRVTHWMPLPQPPKEGKKTDG